MLAPAPRRPNGPPGAATKGHARSYIDTDTPPKKKKKTKPSPARITKPQPEPESQPEPLDTSDEATKERIRKRVAEDLRYQEIMFNAFGPTIFGENWQAIEAYRSRSASPTSNAPGGSDIGASNALEKHEA